MMETIHRFSYHLASFSSTAAAARPNATLRRCCFFIFRASSSSSSSTPSIAASSFSRAEAAHQCLVPIPGHRFRAPPGPLIPHSRRRCHSDSGRHRDGSPAPTVSSRRRRRDVSAEASGWLSGLVSGNKKQSLPEIVKAGDPVLHEPARDLTADEIISDDIQKTIDDMIAVMRIAPGVGLAAPQIGVPLKIIVLEDTKEYISYAPKNDITAQDRRPFDLLVIVNPRLKKKSDKTALFFEGCLSVDGYRAVVERYLEVEVSGLDRHGRPIKVDATGWQARILQHECDHLEGTLYVDKIVPRTFRIVENLDLPLATGCPKLGVRS